MRSARPARRVRVAQTPLAAVCWVGALLAAVAVMSLPRAALAVPVSALIERAHAAGARGDWNAAAHALEEVVSAGLDSSDVLFNLGTAYANAGRFGEAIWRLELVARRNPLAFDAQHNLRAARLRVANRDAGRSGRAVLETAQAFWTWWGELLPIDGSLSLAIACQLAAIACFVAWRRARRSEMARVASAAGGLVLAVLAAAGMSMVFARAGLARSGIVLHDGLRVLQAANADAIPDAAVREGERLTVLGRNGTFVHVQTHGGRAGWLAARDVGELEP